MYMVKKTLFYLFDIKNCCFGGKNIWILRWHYKLDYEAVSSSCRNIVAPKQNNKALYMNTVTQSALILLYMLLSDNI